MLFFKLFLVLTMMLEHILHPTVQATHTCIHGFLLQNSAEKRLLVSCLKNFLNSCDVECANNLKVFVMNILVVLIME